MSHSRPSIAPFVVLTFIYFIVGFLTTINGQFQAPLQNAFLSDVGGLRNTLTTLISFFFFLGYLVNSQLGGKWINRHGYKVALLRALGVMVAGLLLYASSSAVETLWPVATTPSATFSLGEAVIPWGYLLFLAGSFVMGTSAALLQVVINPYVAAYDLPGTSSVQRMNINCAINSIGTTVGPFFVTAVIFAGVSLDSVQATQLLMPILMVCLCVVITTAVTSRLPLPDIQGTHADESQLTRSIWSFRHFALGVLAIFFYVGTEVSVGVNCSMHAKALLESGQQMSFFGLNELKIGDIDLGIPALLATLYWGGMMIGRMVMSFFGGVSPRTILTSTTILATLLLLIGIILDNLWVIVSVGLVHSVMWGAIFTLAVEGLKEYTSKASGVFMMGVFGGAVFPVLQGMMADALGSWQYTWLIAVACELVMLYYALWGSRAKEVA